MEFGVCLPNYGPATAPDAVMRVATAAEAAGYDSVWTTDHILVPESHAQTFGHVIEALITLGYVAGITEKVTLATSILVLPQRDPLLVAKQAAAVDQLSGGRAALGVGVGWIKEEYEYLRTDFHQRGRIEDEWIDVLRTLWTEERPTFHGEWIHFDEAVFEPKPVQPNGVPIYVGGNSDAAIRRAAARGDGWHPSSRSPDDLAAGVAKLRDWSGGRPLTISLRNRVVVDELRGPSGRPANDPRYRIAGAPAAIVEELGEYADAGLDHLVCYFDHQSESELMGHLERFASEVMPVFRS